MPTSSAAMCAVRRRAWRPLSACLSYLSYAYAHGSWANPALIGVSVFAGVFLPSYAKLSNKAELWANNQFGFVTAGRLGRFIPQLAFNLAVFWIMLWGGALNRDGIASVGGLASARAHHHARVPGHPVSRPLSGRARHRRRQPQRAGRRRRSTSSWRRWARPALPGAREAFLVLGFGLGALFFGVGLLSDLRSVAGAQGRHRPVLRHLQSVPQHPSRDHAARHRRARPRQDHHPSDARSRVCMPTPSARARSGSDGWRTASRSTRRPTRPMSNVDYFPTGNMFLPPETRKALIELAVAEAGMADKVEVAFYPRDLQHARASRA